MVRYRTQKNPVYSNENKRRIWYTVQVIKEQLKISVIVPVYNVESYLNDCLVSISKQIDSNFDVLLVNDGSTDGSLEILKKWQTKDLRFHVYNRENGGLSAARNTGLEHSSGELVVFVDSDDVIKPDYLSSLREALQVNNADISVCDMEYFDETGKLSFSDGGNFTITSVAETPSLIRINNSACNKMFRRELFRDTLFPEGVYYEDLATVPLLLYKAKKVVKVNKALYAYRQRSGSIAHHASPKIFEIYDAIDRVKSEIQKQERKGNSQVIQEVDHLYVIHGLDLTTLRIKDFDQKDIRKEYLVKNIVRLTESAPEYEKDSFYRHAPLKKKLIWELMKHNWMSLVLRIYD